MSRDHVAALHEALAAGRRTSGPAGVDVVARWRRLCEGRTAGTPNRPGAAGGPDAPLETAPGERPHSATHNATNEATPNATNEATHSADRRDGRRPHG